MRKMLVPTIALFVLVGLACGDGDDGVTDPVIRTGSLRVDLTITGEDLDPDGCDVSLDGGPSQVVSIGGSVTYAHVGVGEHLVELFNMASNCTVAGDNPRSVSVSADDTTRTTFEVNCAAQVGSIQVTAETAGDDLDPDGYSVAVDEGTPQILEANGSVTFPELAIGDHSLVVGGVAENCAFDGNSTRTVTVSFNQTSHETLQVTCDALVGDLVVVTETIGQDIDPDGYIVMIDDEARATRIGTNSRTDFYNVGVGEHQVELREIADNCAVMGENPRSVVIGFRETETVTIELTCTIDTADKLIWPIDCVPGGRCYSDMGYPDTDGDGIAFNCGAPGYTGHSGTDIGFTWEQLDAGMDVFAAASGEVLWVFDGKYDRCPNPDEPDCQTPSGPLPPGSQEGTVVCTELGDYCAQGSCCCYWCFAGGNTVVIRHTATPGVFATTYGHLRKNSILVTPGERVRQGQKIAEAASSGASSGPHLDFSVWGNGFWELADPWAGPCGPNTDCSLWAYDPPWAGN